ncbi:ATP-binding protein [Phyllobacterium myrsinacearum]|uniref:AAA+ ATPase domain-containing protein n=1 Tax=Phyllobacterium myrsinacearum TaxID=28101 RepID=A0A839EJ70_9HYPH|nr:ATP-binding protein [Phyllobacterium myrsinacearum]MBA8878295.1 hypothetical protein [Phyllobacterium myrsinacearum]
MNIQNVESSPEPAEEAKPLSRAARAEIMGRVLGMYFGGKLDKELSSEIERLIDACEMSNTAKVGVGRLAEGRILAVIGRPGAGKSRSLERQFYTREEFAGFRSEDSNCRLISVKAPSPCTLKQLGNSILVATGYEIERDLKENMVWMLVHKRLQKCGIQYLHIDEAQHATETANKLELKKVRDTVKALLQNPDWPVWLIISGKPSLASFIEHDIQLKRRARTVRIEDITFAKHAQRVRGMMKALVTNATELTIDPADEDRILPRLIHAAQGQFGIAVEYVQDSINEALIAGDIMMGTKHFASSYSSRSGCSSDANVFTAANWHEINVARALEDAQNEIEVEENYEGAESAAAKKIRIQRSQS